LAGFAAALDAGAAAIECDIQLSRDGRPLVFHDASLARLTGMSADIRDLDAAACASLRLLGPDGLPSTELLPPLHALVGLLARRPGARLFAEIKGESLVRFGLASLLPAVLQVLAPVRAQTVIISFDAEVVRGAHAAGWPAGWVLEVAGAAAHAQALAMQAEWLFFDGRALPELLGPAWHGPWQLAAYETSDARQARDWLQRGAGWIETDDIGGLLAAV
jgi:glycerophosphoryl diester phosphodiesterase